MLRKTATALAPARTAQSTSRRISGRDSNRSLFMKGIESRRTHCRRCTKTWTASAIFQQVWISWWRLVVPSCQWWEQEVPTKQRHMVSGIWPPATPATSLTSCSEGQLVRHLRHGSSLKILDNDGPRNFGAVTATSLKRFPHRATIVRLA